MKYIIILAIAFSASAFAEENEVLRFSKTENETKDLLGRTTGKSSYISEVTLKNCNFNVSFNSQKEFEITVKKETFTTKNYSVERQENDNCVLKLSNGNLIKS